MGDVITTEVSSTTVEAKPVHLEEPAPEVDETLVEQEAKETTETQEKPEEKEELVKPEKVEKEELESDDLKGEKEEPVVLKYGDIEFNMEDLDIPDDLKEGLSEKGFNVEDLAKQLYSEEGLSAETKQKLYDAYGKFAVDATLRSIETENKMNLAEAKSAKEAATKAAETAWNETLEIVGDEKGWNDLTAWAEKSLSDDALAELNDVMENGTWTAQKLIIKGLQAEKDKGVVGEKDVELTDLDNSSLGGDDDGPMTFVDYNKLISSGEYGKLTAAEQNTIDQRRRAGMNLGI